MVDHSTLPLIRHVRTHMILPHVTIEEHPDYRDQPSRRWIAPARGQYRPVRARPHLSLQANPPRPSLPRVCRTETLSVAHRIAECANSKHGSTVGKDARGGSAKGWRRGDPGRRHRHPGLLHQRPAALRRPASGELRPPDRRGAGPGPVRGEVALLLLGVGPLDVIEAPAQLWLVHGNDMSGHARGGGEGTTGHRGRERRAGPGLLRGPEFRLLHPPNRFVRREGPRACIGAGNRSALSALPVSAWVCYAYAIEDGEE